MQSFMWRHVQDKQIFCSSLTLW